VSVTSDSLVPPEASPGVKVLVSWVPVMNACSDGNGDVRVCVAVAAEVQGTVIVSLTSSPQNPFDPLAAAPSQTTCSSSIPANWLESGIALPRLGVTMAVEVPPPDW
jgi:hypothetical protein